MDKTDVAKQEHYTKLSPEPIDVIRAWKLGFNLGNVVKYIGRCETKGDKLLDLKKAKQYLEWEIEELEGTKFPPQRKPGLYRRTLEEAIRRRQAVSVMGVNAIITCWHNCNEYQETRDHSKTDDSFWLSYYEEVK